MTRPAMIFLLTVIFLASIAAIFAASGSSLAATGLIVLGWLGVGLGLGLLMARSRR